MTFASLARNEVECQGDVYNASVTAPIVSRAKEKGLS